MWPQLRPQLDGAAPMSRLLRFLSTRLLLLLCFPIFSPLHNIKEKLTKIALNRYYTSLVKIHS